MNTYRNRPTLRLLALMLLLLCLLPTAATAAGPIEQPESVQLEYVTGTANYPSHVLVEWQSVSEIATVLYRVYRATVNNPAQAILISPDISAHPGSTQGYTYSYQDTLNLVGGTTYYYWIQDEDINGATTTHLEPNLVPIVPWGCSRYDVVCNFVVDTQDFTAIANSWNCVTGNSCYVAAYDLNNNGRIDVIDLTIDTSRWNCQFGQACYS